MDDDTVENAVGPVDDAVESAVESIDEVADEPVADDSDATGVEPDVDDLTGPIRRLDPRVRYLWAFRAAVGGVVLGGLAGLAAFLLLDGAFWPAPAAFAVAFAVGVGYTVARYRRWSYQVREDSLFLDRGVVTEVRTVVPYVRIQHVDVSRGPLERLLGLASVVVYTAGSRGADVTVPGLPPDRADDLQTRLKQLAIVAEGEDAV